MSLNIFKYRELHLGENFELGCPNSEYSEMLPWSPDRILIMWDKVFLIFHQNELNILPLICKLVDLILVLHQSDWQILNQVNV